MDTDVQQILRITYQRTKHSKSFTSSQSSLKRTKSGSSMPPIDRLSFKNFQSSSAIVYDSDRSNQSIDRNARVLINDCSNHKQNCDDNFNDNGGKKASAKRSIKNKICLQRSISNLGDYSLGY